MKATIGLLHYEDSMIHSFLQKYLLKNNDKKGDLFSAKMKEFRFLAEKQNELLNVVMIDNEVAMIYEVITDIKSFAIERFCYEDFDVLNQFDGFVESLYYLDQHLDIIHDLFAKEYRNYLLFNFEDSVYGTYGHKALSSYKPLSMTFKSFFSEGYDKFNSENDYLQSIHSDITNDMLYNTFIKSFIKEYDSYEVRVYDLNTVESKNNLKLLFSKELPIVNESNTLKNFGYNLFWKRDINATRSLSEEFFAYIVLVGIKGFEEKPLTVLRFSGIMVNPDNDIKGLMINYVETNYIYNESKDVYEKMVYEKLNNYMNEIEEELLVVNSYDINQTTIRGNIHKYMTNPYILESKDSKEFLERIRLIK